MHTSSILIVGGSGYFGGLLIEDLLRHTESHVIVAGRNEDRLAETRRRLGRPFEDRLSCRRCDLDEPASIRPVLAEVQLAICAAGPFQELPRTLVELCLEQRVPYLDLADGRAFVTRVHELVAAREANEMLPPICTGWSAVPALSAAMTRIAAEGLEQVESIDIHIAPGNRNPRSGATVSSLLASVGSSFTVPRRGGWREVTGWSEPRPFAFPNPVGTRVGYLVDAPDHELFVDLFCAERVEFRVGSELGILNRGLCLLRWLSRRGLCWKRFIASPVFRALMASLGFLGSSSGAVGVRVCGWSGGDRKASQVCVVADRHGERIPVMVAAVMASRLLNQPSEYRGLVPLDGWLTRTELELECRRRGFRLVVNANVDV